MGMKDKHWQVYLAGRMSGISHSDAIGWRYDIEKLFRNVEKYHGCKFTVINPAWQLKIPVFVFGIEQDPHPWIDRCITRYEKSMNDVVEYIEDFYCS